MTRLFHVLIGLAYCLAGLVIAGVLSRVSGVEPALAWLVGVGFVLLSIQAHVFAARTLAEQRLAARISALGQAQSHIVDELTAARVARLDMEDELRDLALDMERALNAEAARLDDAVVAMNRRLEIGPAPQDNVHAAARVPARRSSVALSAGDLREAIADGRVDLVAQPIVTLPQRRTAHYETFTRVRTQNGDTAPASTWLAMAEKSGVIEPLDLLGVQRSLAMAQRFDDKGSAAGVFCNLSGQCVDDDEAFARLMDAMKGKTGLARHVILEMRQHALRQMSLVGHRNMRRLADFGFRFSLDHVRDVDLDLPALRAASVRFIKIKGDTLMEMINAGGPLGVGASPEVSVQDFPELLSRSGMSLVVEKVESESTVVEALDYPIPLGQGHLFGAPRPVRSDVLADAA